MNENRVSIKVISLSQEVEICLRKNLVKKLDVTKIELNEYLMSKLIKQIEEAQEFCFSNGLKKIPIICRPDIRLYFRRLIENKFPSIMVISYLEIPPEFKIDILFIIKFDIDFNNLNTHLN